MIIIYRFLKSLLDKIFALIGIIIFMPLIIILSIAVAIDSKGPAIFLQERVGKGGKLFKMVKFRTMRTTGIPFDINNPVIEDDNQNLTKVGRFIRRFKLDEFLQLFNVLKGDMNFIGPRPLLPVYMEHYQPWEKEKFKLKPGMSGLAQVNGNGHLLGVERSYYDVLYIKKENPFTDLGIVLKTVAVVFGGEEKYIKRVDDAQLDEVRTEFELTGKISRKKFKMPSNASVNTENVDKGANGLQKADGNAVGQNAENNADGSKSAEGE